LGMCLAVLGCAGRKPVAAPGSLTNDNSVKPRVDTPDAGAGAATQADAGSVSDALEGPPPVVDPAVAHALLAKSGEASGSAALGLRFEVIELSAALPWAFAVVNRGTEAALVDFDARLLTLEVELPLPPAKLDARGKPSKPAKPTKPVLCRLPAGVVPSAVDPALAIKLEPGAGLVQNFDPRLYCIGKAPWPLLAGAQVSPRFGWPPALKVSYRAGKREEVPGLQHEPFVAEPSEAQGSLPEASTGEAERRVKELSGTPLTLGSDFADSEAGRLNEPAVAPGLELTLAGGDASDEGAVTATATIVNHGKRKQDLYFRRELITYEVSGPDGVFHCNPEPDKRSASDRSQVQTLAAGARFSAVSRLIEMCPAHTFARPGLYLVHARFDAADPATDLGFNAFMGRLVSKKPALVRVRQGELPFTPTTGVMRVHVGE
jgi:hypothetical protein